MKYNFDEENLKDHYWFSDDVFVLVFGYSVTNRIEIEYIKSKYKTIYALIGEEIDNDVCSYDIENELTDSDKIKINDLLLKYM